MRGFIVKCLLLVLVLYAGVLIGMEKASDEKKQSNYETYSLQAPSLINEQDVQNIETTLVENNIAGNGEGENVQENIESNNIFSKAGSTLAETITNIMKKTIDVLSSFI
ncbi:hypothetical protein [Bacillus sp. FSL K6-3431]|uniref:hypothetical protein n=1 Tax=Bacillus sp. FSL K6-3431 TaxID=2921500 RepID=UPI0030FCDB81